jgi:hypothetical protein
MSDQGLAANARSLIPHPLPDRAVPNRSLDRLFSRAGAPPLAVQCLRVHASIEDWETLAK